MQIATAAMTGSAGTSARQPGWPTRGDGSPFETESGHPAMKEWMPPETTPSDAQLIAASASDADAFMPVFERHVDRVHRFLRGQVGDQAVEDLTSEVFLVAFRRRGDYDPRYPDAAPWLLGIAANLARSHRRGLRRAGALLRRLGPERAPDVVAEIDERVSARASRDELGRALRSLRPQEREVVLLSICGELGHREIARALGIAEGTVRTRLHRGRTALHAALTEPDSRVSPTPREEAL